MVTLPCIRCGIACERSVGKKDAVCFACKYANKNTYTVKKARRVKRSGQALKA